MHELHTSTVMPHLICQVAFGNRDRRRNANRDIALHTWTHADMLGRNGWQRNKLPHVLDESCFDCTGLCLYALGRGAGAHCTHDFVYSVQCAVWGRMGV